MEEVIKAAEERVASLLEPINGGVGEDISYDEQFDEIKNETEKLSSLSGEVCDWGSVAVTSREILEEKSKDFRVACYLATCKCREGTIDGVLDGLVLLKGITDKYWDDMFPPLRRMRARAGMVGWWSEQSGTVMIDYPLKPEHNGAVQAAEELSKGLDALWRDKFGEHYPGMVKLRDAVRHWVRTCPKEAPKP
ncbi:MAG: type VI secretion system ImpA family N-terminal domain-containing protein, partial [Myxococcales bacterium]|nr:type VI secretion system ImpA family N-terminal domain-containing protein [Myxococcales bacterium]